MVPDSATWSHCWRSIQLPVRVVERDGARKGGGCEMRSAHAELRRQVVVVGMIFIGRPNALRLSCGGPGETAAKPELEQTSRQPSPSGPRQLQARVRQRCNVCPVHGFAYDSCQATSCQPPGRCTHTKVASVTIVNGLPVARPPRSVTRLVVTTTLPKARTVRSV